MKNVFHFSTRVQNTIIVGFKFPLNFDAKLRVEIHQNSMLTHALRHLYSSDLNFNTQTILSYNQIISILNSLTCNSQRWKNAISTSIFKSYRIWLRYHFLFFRVLAPDIYGAHCPEYARLTCEWACILWVSLRAGSQGEMRACTDGIQFWISASRIGTRNSHWSDAIIYMFPLSSI
jgi:hypothetical protein